MPKFNKINFGINALDKTLNKVDRIIRDANYTRKNWTKILKKNQIDYQKSLLDEMQDAIEKNEIEIAKYKKAMYTAAMNAAKNEPASEHSKSEWFYYFQYASRKSNFQNNMEQDSDVDEEDPDVDTESEEDAEIGSSDEDDNAGGDSVCVSKK